MNVPWNLSEPEFCFVLFLEGFFYSLNPLFVMGLLKLLISFWFNFGVLELGQGSVSLGYLHNEGALGLINSFFIVSISLISAPIFIISLHLMDLCLLYSCFFKYSVLSLSHSFLLFGFFNLGCL